MGYSTAVVACWKRVSCWKEYNLYIFLQDLNQIPLGLTLSVMVLTIETRPSFRIISYKKGLFYGFLDLKGSC